MKFDEQGHLVCTPVDLFELAVANPRQLIGRYLMTGTPLAFPQYADYCAFLEAVSERTSIHPRNLYVRGSSHIGFSIAPNVDKVWLELGADSDIDLVIVDANYFRRCEAELRAWEHRNPVSQGGKGSKAAARRAQDRQFNCFRDNPLPNVVCVHHKNTMGAIAAVARCGHLRGLSAFVYPDWYSAQERYEFDLRELCKGVTGGWLAPPPAVPLPRPPAATAPSQVQAAIATPPPSDLAGPPSSPQC